MTPQEFAKDMTFMGLAYNKEFTKDQLNVWYSFFNEADEKDFRKAITRLITKEKFMPSISDIKSEIASLNNPALQLKPEEAWDKVEKAISKYGFYNSEDAEASFDPFTAYVVRHMGGFRKLCLSEDGDWTRKNFMKLFEDMSETKKELHLFSEPQMTLPELQRMAELKTQSVNMIGIDET